MSTSARQIFNTDQWTLMSLFWSLALHLIFPTFEDYLHQNNAVFFPFFLQFDNNVVTLFLKRKYLICTQMYDIILFEIWEEFWKQWTRGWGDVSFHLMSYDNQSSLNCIQDWMLLGQRGERNIYYHQQERSLAWPFWTTTWQYSPQ